MEIYTKYNEEQKRKAGLIAVNPENEDDDDEEEEEEEEEEEI